VESGKKERTCNVWTLTRQLLTNSENHRFFLLLLRRNQHIFSTCSLANEPHPMRTYFFTRAKEANFSNFKAYIENSRAVFSFWIPSWTPLREQTATRSYVRITGSELGSSTSDHLLPHLKSTLRTRDRAIKDLQHRTEKTETESHKWDKKLRSVLSWQGARDMFTLLVSISFIVALRAGSQGRIISSRASS